MNIILQRLNMIEKGTLGVMMLDGKPLFSTLELPWKDNQHNISCYLFIPIILNWLMSPYLIPENHGSIKYISWFYYFNYFFFECHIFPFLSSACCFNLLATNILFKIINYSISISEPDEDRIF